MTTTRVPLVPEVGVLALGHHEWREPWMPQHYTLTRLARYFHVVWMDPAQGWREILHGRSAPPSRAREGNGGPAFHVYEPEPWLPEFFRPPWLARFTFRQRVRRARRLLRLQGCQRIVLSLWHPSFAPALSAGPFDLTCYHVEDEYSFSEAEVPLDQAENQLMAAVQQVFMVSPGLLERKGIINSNTVFSPNGVDYQSYATPVAEPVDLVTIPRPRIGYTGFLKKQLDWRLLLRLVRERPEWSFVFVGPRRPHPEINEPIEELTRKHNVYFLGEKSTRELSAYPQHFDVCIMPYHVNDYTKYIYPLKLHEYLASGRPVVGTKIRSLRDYHDVVFLVDSPDEWSRRIEMALDPEANTVERRSQRQAVARAHDWDGLVRSIACTMAKHLGVDIFARVDADMRGVMIPPPLTR